METFGPMTSQKLNWILSIRYHTMVSVDRMTSTGFLQPVAVYQRRHQWSSFSLSISILAGLPRPKLLNEIRPISRYGQRIVLGRTPLNRRIEFLIFFRNQIKKGKVNLKGNLAK